MEAILKWLRLINIINATRKRDRGRMAIISRYIIKYKDQYARPARYVSVTKYVLQDDKGDLKEYICGRTFKNWGQFVLRMKEIYPTLIVDSSKPNVIYQ